MVKVEINRELMNILENSTTFVTAKEVSGKLHVSTKTIYRAIEQINTKVGGSPLIQKAKGKGIKLNQYRHEKSNDRFSATEVLQPKSLSPNRRREQILLRLLYLSPSFVKVNALYENFYVSESVINNDEKIMGKWLKDNHLRLLRENHRIWVSGDELDIRKSISDLTDLGGVIDFNHIFSKSNVSLNQRDINFVINLVRRAEKDLKVEIPYPYDINIFSHIYILINRYRNVGKKSTIENNKNVLVGYHFDPELIQCAKQMASNIEKYANISLSKSETIYMYQYLESSRIFHFNKKHNQISPKVKNISKAYIDIVNEVLGTNILQEQILQDLVKHIRPMLNRLANGIYASNELLGEIRSEYPKIFKAVEYASDRISRIFNLPNIPENEIGFISIYFAREVESNVQSPKVLITCTTGVGTAQLLKVKVNKFFPNFIVNDVLSIGQFLTNKTKYQNIDFVISTVPFNQPIKMPVVVVSALFNQRDKNAIKETISKIKG